MRFFVFPAIIVSNPAQGARTTAVWKFSRLLFCYTKARKRNYAPQYILIMIYSAFKIAFLYCRILLR